MICSFVALFHSVQDSTRLNAKDYFEIFLDPSIDELVKKNKKNLYSDRTDYMFNQIPKHQFPKDPELRINTIINGVYQDYLSEIKIKIFDRLNIISD